MDLYLATVVIAYLLGSIPFGYILVRAFHGQDVRQTGSGNIGATNVARAAPALGALTLVLDAAKGFAAVLAGMMLAQVAAREFGRSPLFLFAALAALCAVLGHLFPVWLKFRGGKGVATSVGVFIALAPKALLIAILIFAALVAAFRYVSLGSIIAVAAFPVLAFVLNDYHSSPPVLGVICFVALLIIAKHHENIRRLFSGTEHRFALKRTRA
jgi:glycerol-3-phosphate acyltransferase PlsY